ncbi:MAG: YggS family pyridoxal phosphate-dependent enzyme [Ferruginibacter sp.]
MINKEKYQEIIKELSGKATLVAVSKTKPIEDIQALYDLGHRDFGENYVQELVDKEAQLPKDIRWHFIGHLQSNKVKYIAPFIHLIHGIDSEKLLTEINKQALKKNRVIDCLLQVYIAKEETKFGLDENELHELIRNTPINELTNIRINGLMGMASFVNDEKLIRKEFQDLYNIFQKIKNQSSHLSSSSLSFGEGLGRGFSTLSMGMSADYTIALEEGSNMLRIGSLLFGARNYNG